MTQPIKEPKPADKATKPPLQAEVDKQAQREKAEVQEVAGRHKNDGQKGHKGRR